MSQELRRDVVVVGEVVVDPNVYLPRGYAMGAVESAFITRDVLDQLLSARA